MTIRNFLIQLIVYIFVALIITNWYLSNFIESKNPNEVNYHSGAYLEIYGSKIYYQQFATTSEQNVILVGGTAAWSGVWEKTVNDLKNSYNIYALDLPPFGYSIPKEDYKYTLENQAYIISSLIEKKDLQNVILIAHSYGAGPGIESAFINQGKIKKMVIVDGVIHLDPSKVDGCIFEKLLSIVWLRTFVTKVALHTPGFLRSRLESFVYKKEMVDSYWVEKYGEPLNNKGSSENMAAWVHDFLYIPENGLSNSSKNYSDFKVPTLILWGRQDDLTPLSQGENLAKIIPNSKLIILEDTGHIPMIDDYQQFIEALIQELF